MASAITPMVVSAWAGCRETPAQLTEEEGLGVARRTSRAERRPHRRSRPRSRPRRRTTSSLRCMRGRPRRVRSLVSDVSRALHGVSAELARSCSRAGSGVEVSKGEATLSLDPLGPTGELLPPTGELLPPRASATFGGRTRTGRGRTGRPFAPLTTPQAPVGALRNGISTCTRVPPRSRSSTATWPSRP